MKKRKPMSIETKRKISLAKMGIWISFNCDYCNKKNQEKQSHYNRKKRHFCNRKCYSNFRKELLPKEEQHAYKGGGMSESDRVLRKQARSILNHSIRYGKTTKPAECSRCGSKEKIEGHHKDYYKPMEVIWLCFKCHRKIHQDPHLIN